MFCRRPALYDADGYRANLLGGVTLRLTHRFLLPLLCFLFIVPGLFAQTITPEEQTSMVAPTVTRRPVLSSTLPGDTLHRGDWSFGIYFQDYDVLAAPARDFAPPSARSYRDMGYDLYRANVSLGYGLTDRWEVSASLPWDRIQNHGGDRVGFINGWFYQ